MTHSETCLTASFNECLIQSRVWQVCVFGTTEEEEEEEEEEDLSAEGLKSQRGLDACLFWQRLVDCKEEDLAEQ